MDEKRKSTTVAPPLTPPRTPPRTPPSTTIGQPSQAPALSTEQEIHQVIRQALDLLERDDHDAKALNLIKETIHRYPRSSTLHYTEGKIHFYLAIVDVAAKAKHLEDGIRSAELAVEFSQNSTSCARLLADLHEELAVFDNELFDLGFTTERPTFFGMKDLFGEDLSKESRFEDDMKWLEDIESVKDLDFDAKKAVEAGNTEDKEKKDSEVMAADVRKKQLKAIMKKLKDNNEDISRYRQFWNVTLSDEKKRGFRKVNIEELANHLTSLKDQSAVDLLLEAIEFAKVRKTWRFWECYDCVTKFGYCHLFSKHHWLVHWVGDKSIWRLDDELWKESTGMIVEGEWRPLDSNEAFVNPKKSEKGLHKIVEWAYSDDIERSEILRRIRSIFLLLLKNKCLPPVVVRWAIEYTREQLKIVIPVSQFRRFGLKRLQIVCFLGASQLIEVLNFLKDVVHTCGLSKKVEMNKSMDDKLSDHHVFDIKERVLFSKDFTCLLLDERVLQGKLTATNYVNADAGVVSAVDFSADKSEDDVLPQSDEIVAWLYMGSNCGEGLESWKSLMESRRRQAKECQRVFLEKLSVLPPTCSNNNEIRSKLKAIQKVENLYLKEIEKKENSLEIESQFYVDLLKKCQMELQVLEDVSNRTGLHVISEALEKTQEVTSRYQSGSEGCSAEDKLRMQKCIEETDNCMKLALKQLKMQFLKELSCHDAINQRRVGVLDQYVQNIIDKTVCDYRSIVVPMLKSFLQSHLKNLYEDAQAKSKAAEEVLLALEAENKISKDSEDVKQNQDKKNKKKKNKKKNKKNKNPETSKEEEQTDEDEKQTNEMRLIDAERKKRDDQLSNEAKKLSLADAVKKLDEHLEYQRRFEHEASLKANAGRSGNEGGDSGE